jgi:hypothetical protein
MPVSRIFTHVETVEVNRNGNVDQVEASREDFKGFDRNFTGSDLNHVVLVKIDGEIDVWAIDDPRNVGSLVSYLADHAGGEVEILGAYSRK